MNIRHFIVSLCLFVLLPGSLLAGEADELQRIRKNYIRALLPSGDESEQLVRLLSAIPKEQELSDQMVAELHQRYPLDVDKILTYLRAMKPDGSWADINYADTRRSGWEPKTHAERVLEMTKLYCSTKTSYHHSTEVEKAIRNAMQYWFTTQPVSLNWWQNQIGVPKTMGAAFVLFENKLTPAEREGAIGVMQQARFGMTGQNKVWLAGNVLIRGLLQNDFELVKAARDTIASEIVTGQTEGIKEDWSFHQHGPQQQFGNYGLAFISGMSFYSGLFNGTSLAFDEKQLTILSTLLEEGYRWILWNGYMDISSLGRQLYHNAPIHKAFCVAFAAASLAESGLPAADTAFKHIMNENFLPQSGKNSFTGHKHFYCSDYTIHRAPQWMASVKMASTRVIGTELVNEDNLLGYYLADGATYYYIRGNEYLNDFPFWDWRKVPGITSYETDAPLPRMQKAKTGNESAFVGGVTDGHYGLTAMQLNRDGLKAHKAWLFTDEFVLCLGAGIASDSLLPVTTTIDQRGKQADLLYLKDKTRFFHDNTGYIVLDGTSCTAEATTRNGQWHDFMQMYQPETLEREMVTLSLNHGTCPKDAAYQYIVLPASTQEAVAAFKPSRIRIIRNDAKAQVIILPKENIYCAVVYENNLSLGSNFPVKTEKAGLYLVIKQGKEYKIYYDNPLSSVGCSIK